ncbi:MAG: formylglycine-generating enzyme family protein [Albidovulum sp.]|nr:formylglycine-generating enzyme family protein [Albidovulum sp.]
MAQVDGYRAGDQGPCPADHDAAGSKGEGSLIPERLGMEFVTFEAGSFTMGSPEGERDRRIDEGPVSVTLTRPFAIAATEVTQRQWFAVMRRNPSYFKLPEDCANHKIVNRVGICLDLPVESVSWNDAQRFLKKLNRMEGNKGCGKDKTAKEYYSMPTGCYRLPTEAEWEYAARSGAETAYLHGNSGRNLDSYAWYDGDVEYGQAREVAQKRPNRRGLHDTGGNVWEWLQDWYGYELPGGVNPLQTVSETTSAQRVQRGGGWYSYPMSLRSAFRSSDIPNKRNNDVGFRIVRVVDGP